MTRSTLGAQHALHVRLLFDADLRRRFRIDPAATLRAEGFSPDEAAPFLTVSPRGLELDAGGRARTIMTALCASFPLTTAALGARPGGADRLGAFLGSAALFRPAGERTRAFGSFLGGVLEANETEEPAEVGALLRPFLDLELGRATIAAALGPRAESGDRQPSVETYVPGTARGRLVVLAPFTLAVALPVPTHVLAVALDHVTPRTAWSAIWTGSLSAARVRSVAWGRPVPVTVLCRGVVTGSSDPRAGDLPPLVDVAYRQVELSGRRDGLLAACESRLPFDSFVPQDQATVEQLLAAGVLALA